MSSDEEIKSINQIKKDKKEKKIKEKKPLSDIVIEQRRNNMKKALETKALMFKQKNNLNIIENNLQSIINIDSDDEYKNEINKIEKSKSPKRKKDKEKDNYIMKTLNEKLEKIQSRVEKLYLLKKNKNRITPIDIPKKEDNINEKQNERVRESSIENTQILRSIKNKLLQQY